MGFEKIEQQKDKTLIDGLEDQTSPEGLEEKMALQRAVLGKIVEGSGMEDTDITLWLQENGEAMSYLLAKESMLIKNFLDDKSDKENFLEKLDETKELLQNKTLL